MITLTNDEATALARQLATLANTLDGVRAGGSLDGTDHSRLYDAAKTARDVAQALRPAAHRPNPALIRSTVTAN